MNSKQRLGDRRASAPAEQLRGGKRHSAKEAEPHTKSSQSKPEH